MKMLPPLFAFLFTAVLTLQAATKNEYLQTVDTYVNHELGNRWERMVNGVLNAPNPPPDGKFVMCGRGEFYDALPIALTGVHCLQTGDVTAGNKHLNNALRIIRTANKVTLDGYDVDKLEDGTSRGQLCFAFREVVDACRILKEQGVLTGSDLERVRIMMEMTIDYRMKLMPQPGMDGLSNHMNNYALGVLMTGMPPQQPVLSTNFDNIQIRPVTQRPCLLMDAADIPEGRRRWELIPNRPDAKHMDATLYALLYGDAAAKKKATVEFMADVRRIFNGSGKNALWEQRRVNELLYKYDVIASFGLLTKEEQQEFEADAVRFAKFEVGDDPARFPSPQTPSTNGLEFPTGFSTCNRWPDRFLGAALVGLNFPDQPLAKPWVRYACQQIQFMLEKGNWDGAWNEVPRYHNWTMMLFSTLFEALQRRACVDFYQDPNTKALLDWYVRFSSPLVRFPETTKSNPVGEPTLPVWGDSNYGSAFTVPAMFAPHYAVSDPAFSKRLMWMWRRAGSPFQHGWQFDWMFPLLTDPTLPDEPQTLGSDFCQKFGYVLLRSGFNTPDETVIYMRGGQHGITHQRSDLGSIDLFSQGIPLALGSQSGPYGEGIEWNRSQISNNDVVFGGKPRDRGECSGKIDAWFTSPQADYAVADCSRPVGRFVKQEESFHWRRHLLLVKNPDYLVVWDEISSPIPAQWYLHTTGKKLIWGKNLITSQTAYNADLDIHVLSPVTPLVPNEQEGIFGVKDKLEAPYPFYQLKYFSIPAQPNEDFLTILHPRKPDGTPLSATLVSSSKEKITLKITNDSKSDLINLSTEGASFQRGISLAMTIPMQIQVTSAAGKH